MFHCIVLREEPQHGALGERWVIFSTIQWEFLMEQIAIIMQSMGSNYVATIFLLSSSLKANCFGSFYTLSDSIKEHSSTMEKVFNSGTCSFFYFYGFLMYITVGGINVYERVSEIKGFSYKNVSREEESCGGEKLNRNLSLWRVEKEVRRTF